MMQFKARYQAKQFDSIRCVEIVSTYAPLLFRKDLLEQLGQVLKSQRRIERNTAADLGHALATANRRLIDAHRLWNLIAQSSDTKASDLESKLGGDQAEWESLAARWIELGVLVRASTPQSTEMLALASRVEAPCRGKCPCCGSIVRALKRRLLESQQCPKCRSEILFCLLS
jgi:hypothetical protein